MSWDEDHANACPPIVDVDGHTITSDEFRALALASGRMVGYNTSAAAGWLVSTTVWPDKTGNLRVAATWSGLDNRALSVRYHRTEDDAHRFHGEKVAELRAEHGDERRPKRP